MFGVKKMIDTVKPQPGLLQKVKDQAESDARSGKPMDELYTKGPDVGVSGALKQKYVTTYKATKGSSRRRRRRHTRRVKRSKASSKA